MRIPFHVVPGVIKDGFLPGQPFATLVRQGVVNFEHADEGGLAALFGAFKAVEYRTEARFLDIGEVGMVFL